MDRTKLQNDIIKKVLDINDINLLNYFNNILDRNTDTSLYKLSDFEKTIINESITEYSLGKTISNDEVFSKNQKWLEK